MILAADFDGFAFGRGAAQAVRVAAENIGAGGGLGGSGLGFLKIGPLILYGLESGFRPSACVAPRMTINCQSASIERN